MTSSNRHHRPMGGWAGLPTGHRCVVGCKCGEGVPGCSHALPHQPTTSPSTRRAGRGCKKLSEYASEKSWPGRARMQPLPLPMSMQSCGIQRQAPAQPPPLPMSVQSPTVTVGGRSPSMVCGSALHRWRVSVGRRSVVGRRGAARSPAQPLASVSGRNWHGPLAATPSPHQPATSASTRRACGRTLPGKRRGAYIIAFMRSISALGTNGLCK